MSYRRGLKRVALAVLLLAVAAILVARQGDLRLAIAVAKGRLSKLTVADRIQKLEPRVAERLNPALQSKARAYPLKSFTLVVIKDASLLQLYAFDGRGVPVHIKDYPVLAESGTLGPKLREGDRQIPEGIYKVTFLNPNSLYHLSLRLDYPNEFDRKMAKLDGRTNLGGDIMIHGRNVSIGCIAVGDPAIEELFCLAARAGLQNVKVIIVPTDWRTKPFDPLKILGPRWLSELYPALRNDLLHYP